MGVHHTLMAVVALLASSFLLLWLFLADGLRVSTPASRRFALGNALLGVGVLLTLSRGDAGAAPLAWLWPGAAWPAWLVWPLADLLSLAAYATARAGVQALFKQARTGRADGAVFALAVAAYASLPVGPDALVPYIVVYASTAAWFLAGLGWDLWRATAREFGHAMGAMLASPFAGATLLMLSRLWRVDAVAAQALSVDTAPTLWAFNALVLLLNASLLAAVLARLILVLRHRAERDHLTQLYNRRHFDHLLTLEWERAQRTQQPFCLVLLDLDHFKQVNDRLGHAGGDAALRQTARLLDGSRRSIDTVARHGGEEFALLLPGTPLAGGLEVAERLRQRLDQAGFEHGGRRQPLSASLGVASSDGLNDLESLLRLADQALYAAKAAGRNTVRPAASELTPPTGG
jgi:diguanylate cyclase (GGDEF)-like protein